ncbi:MAG: sulfurtransferase TusA family protein [Deltaproteobacteria bacterium]|jgi:sulfite reductase (ferredoxin)|nr:sulfurtransferase TusA family protein [Deltaproteobacteria bacterium]
MKFYEIPKNLEKEIDDLESSIKKFRNGELHPTKFRAQRVPFGVYEQRTQNTFMVRIRMTAGGITPVQLEKVALIAKKYAKPFLHITTRQELQIHDAELEDLPGIMKELYDIGLSSRGGGGNTLRNIMASYDSGVNPNECFDVTAHAVALSTLLVAQNDSWNFPRKFKISFSSTKKDNALAAFNDLGFIATIKDGQKGFKVYVAGGLGCRPRPSKILHDFIPEDKVHQVTLAVKNLFLFYGNRKSKNSSRLRFLFEELGEVKFFDLYNQEFQKLKNTSKLELHYEQYINKNETQKELPPRFINLEAFDLWKERFVKDQAQEGLKSVLVPVALGDLNSDDAVKLARFLKNFGENVIRLTMTQNMVLRNIPLEYLGNLFELVNEINTESHLGSACANITICAGADTCTTGVCLPKGVVPVIKKYLGAARVFEKLDKDFKINISGCPNSCGQHHIADIGIYGRIARNNGKALPGYWITAGADRNPDTRAFTEKCGWVPARNLPEAITHILNHYILVKDQYPTFKAYFKSIGKSEIRTICKRFSSLVPYFENDKSFYFDWGAKSQFTTTFMGHGECSAGIYDMIEVEMKIIRSNIKKLSDPDFEHLKKQLLWDIIFSGANMLLITRAVDPEDEAQTFDFFKQHFLDKELVDKKYEILIRDAKNHYNESLLKNQDLVKDFGEIMIKLYHSMDNSLRFPGEEIISIIDSDTKKGMNKVKSEPQKPEVLFKDLRGVACPMNFVKTKVELSKIASGEVLKIFLDDGEPIDNVPRSVLGEGHKIIEQEKTGEYWIVVIEKGKKDK